MSDIEWDSLRAGVVDGTFTPEAVELRPAHLGRIRWSGSHTHLENVARQLERVATGEVEYMMVVVADQPVAKGGIDFAQEPGAGTIWQMATHPEMEGLGLATLLIDALGRKARDRGVGRLRLGVELDNVRARGLYEHLGFEPIGESQASWEAEAEDGSRYLYSTTCTEMLKKI